MMQSAPAEGEACVMCASDIYPELLAARGISGRT